MTTNTSYQQRVRDEVKELGERADKLKDFLALGTFAMLTREEKDLLTKQYGLMLRLKAVLLDRIRLFKPEGGGGPAEE